MTTHRFAAAAVALALVPAGLLLAAGEVDSGTAGVEDRLAAVGFNNAGYPIVDTPITVQAMIRGAAHVNYDFDEMTLIVDLQERSNIDLVFETVPSAQVAEKRNLIFASREYPDLMLNLGVSDRNLWGAAQGADVWALDEMIDAYAPGWKQAFVERPIVRKAITQPDGKVYSLPYYREILNDYGIRDTMAINVDWLRKMGIDKIPDTTEEFYLALKAFRTGIDNGTLPENGVPWLGRFHAWGNGGEWELYNAFGLWMKGQGVGADKYLSVNDGAVEFGATDPKLRDAVKFLHRLFSEGLITEEFFTNTGSDFTPRSRSVPPISGYWGSYFITAPVEEFYDPLPPLMGPTGVRRYRSQPVRLQKNVFTIFSKFEYPEALVRFIDPWADDTFSVEASYGGPVSRRPALAAAEFPAYGRRLTELAEHLASRGVPMTYHPHMGTVIETEEEVDLLMEHTGPAVGLLLDTGHMVFAGGDPLALARRHAARVNHVHCKDIRAAVLAQVRERDMSFLDAVLAGVFTVPGDGSIDFRAVARLLAEIEYAGWVVVEAEQDPAKAHPLTYARIGYAELTAALAQAGVEVIEGRTG